MPRFIQLDIVLETNSEFINFSIFQNIKMDDDGDYDIAFSNRDRP